MDNTALPLPVGIWRGQTVRLPARADEAARIFDLYGLDDYGKTCFALNLAVEAVKAHRPVVVRAEHPDTYRRFAPHLRVLQAGETDAAPDSLVIIDSPDGPSDAGDFLGVDGADILCIQDGMGARTQYANRVAADLLVTRGVVAGDIRGLMQTPGGHYPFAAPLHGADHADHLAAVLSAWG